LGTPEAHSAPSATPLEIQSTQSVSAAGSNLKAPATVRKDSPKGQLPYLRPKKKPKREAQDDKYLHFIELFAGEALLTSVMRKLGVSCEAPNDLETGGTDFGSRIQVETLKAYIQRLRAEGKQLIIHLAPPCSTFSKARDRSRATRLRSTAYPQGLPGLSRENQQIVDEGNAIARNAFAFAEWASKSMDAVVSFENPSGSYMWAYLAQCQGSSKVVYEDAVVSQCFYGAPYRKDTKIRLWHCCREVLQHQCTKTAGQNACGKERHDILEFQGLPTAPAAAYPQKLCDKLASVLVAAATVRPRASQVREQVVFVSEGKVNRHALRGVTL
jgi:hypothetical protein